MEKDLVAVLGGGNGGHAVAANLSLAGFRVNFFELPSLGTLLKRSFAQERFESRGYRSMEWPN